MSWDADLVDDRGHEEGSWNYTHNCNAMMNLALDESYDTSQTTFQEVFMPKTESWWKQLDGMDGPVGAKFLDGIIRTMEADPPKYRALNPENGWGDYDRVLVVLREMRAAVPEWPTTWKVRG